MGSFREQNQQTTLGLLAGLVMCCAASLSLADAPDDESTRSDLASLVELLDSDDLTIRETAATRLSRRTDFDLQAVERLIEEDATLSPEQRMRLFVAGRDFFFQGPHAGMGIQFSQQRLRQGVLVQATVAGFDAARVLRPNDIITSIGGRPITDRDQVSGEILSRAPGETMELVVIRGGRELELSITMGSWADLRNAALGIDRLEMAWRYRLERKGLADPLQVQPALAPGADSLAGSMTYILNQGSAHARISPTANTLESWLVNATHGLVGGGSARGGVDRFDRPRTRIRTVDASVNADEHAAVALQSDRTEEKLALAVRAIQTAQTALNQIRSDYTIRIRRTADAEERASLAKTERIITLAGRHLSEWSQAWNELERSGEFDD